MSGQENPDSGHDATDDVNYVGVVIGAVASLVLMYLSFGFAGGGHGWVSSLTISPASLYLFPSAGALTSARPSAIRQVWSVANILSFIFVDTALYRMTTNEINYFDRVSEVYPLVLWLWFAIWAGGHIAAIVGVVRQFKHDRPHGR